MWFDGMPGWRGAVGVTAAVLSAFCLAGLLATSAWPRMHAGPNQLEAGHRLRSPVDVPLDGLTATAGAYSFRKLRSAYSGPAVKLQRVSDSAQLDIGFLGYVPGIGAPFDVAAANAHCSTACWVESWYDQSGNGRTLERFSGSGPLYVSVCAHGKPCARASAAGELLATLTTPSWVAKTSLSAVANRRGGGCLFIRKGLNFFTGGGAANQWQASDNVTGSNFAASDNTWHAGVVVIDGAGTAVRVDGTEIAIGAITGNTTAERIAAANGGAGIDCDTSEVIAWENYALTLSERAALTANQKNFWGF